MSADQLIEWVIATISNGRFGGKGWPVAAIQSKARQISAPISPNVTRGDTCVPLIASGMSEITRPNGNLSILVWGSHFLDKTAGLPKLFHLPDGFYVRETVNCMLSNLSDLYKYDHASIVFTYSLPENVVFYLSDMFFYSGI